ncbi:MAG: hypothetical protein ACLUNQ_03860 [Oscillospiraceae bacterium]
MEEMGVACLKIEGRMKRPGVCGGGDGHLPPSAG